MALDPHGYRFQHRLDNFDSAIPPAVRAATLTIRKAFEAGLIADGDAWMAAKDAHNAMSHEYDLGAAERVVADIGRVSHPLLRGLGRRLEELGAA